MTFKSQSNRASMVLKLWIRFFRLFT